MTTALHIFLALFVTACLAYFLFGVYLDHVRKQRRRHSLSRYRTYALHQQIRNESLQVTGGACSDARRAP